MTNKSIADRLKVILAKINDDTTSMWEDNLEDTKQVVILEQVVKGTDDEEKEEIEYNGWVDDLEQLLKDLEG